MNPHAASFTDRCVRRRLLARLACALAIIATPVTARAESPMEYSLLLRVIKVQLASARADSGYVRLFGLVNDNDTGGMLTKRLLTNTVTIDVTDASGSLNVSVPLLGCYAQRPRGDIICTYYNGRLRATFVRLQRTPYVYSVLVNYVGLPLSMTGSVLPSGAVKAVIDQGGNVMRADTIIASDCRAYRSNGYACIRP